MSAPVTRRLGPILLVGMLAAPPLFCWFFLRKGYAPSLRRAAFWYTGIQVCVGLIGMISYVA